MLRDSLRLYVREDRTVSPKLIRHAKHIHVRRRNNSFKIDQGNIWIRCYRLSKRPFLIVEAG
jgi:hypothetical protein